MSKISYSEDDSIILQKLIEDGTLDLAVVEEIKTMSKKTEVNKIHTQKICVRKDGRVYTKIKKSSEWKQLIGNDEKDLCTATD